MADNDTTDQLALQVLARSPMFVNIGDRLIVDGNVAQAIEASTITGGVPDASDPLPEGTIIVSP